MSDEASKDFRIHFLNVGHGDATVILLPGSTRAVIVDAFDGKRVLEAIEEEGVDELVAFLSHSDQDHAAGLEYLLDNFGGSILAVFYNLDRIQVTLSSDHIHLLRSLAQATRKDPKSWSHSFNTNLNVDPRFDRLFSGAVTVEVLHPTYSDQSSLLGTTTNETSGVLRVEHSASGRSVLLTGDIQLTGISCLMDRFRTSPEKLRADILKFPHHGAWPTKYAGIRQYPGLKRRTLTEFLAAVDPELVVLSVGHDNSHRHVKPQVFNALLAHRRPGMRLRRMACTQITSTCLRPGASCARPDCAGDTVVRIGDSPSDPLVVHPSEDDHRRQILSMTDLEHAKCARLIVPDDRER
jgi:competence protein ComEC